MLILWLLICNMFERCCWVMWDKTVGIVIDTSRLEGIEIPRLGKRISIEFGVQNQVR